MSVRPLAELASPTSTTPAAAHAVTPAPKSPPEPRATFASLVKAVGAESDRGESLVRRAVAGRAIDPGQLLALQAGIYRYGEVVDLATKLVDRASTGAKTVLQGQ
jgi:hypothetical protein